MALCNPEALPCRLAVGVREEADPVGQECLCCAGLC